ncbi:MAG: helix-turn-helix domain-containing protein [Rhodobacteraceae bacterium]|nr:helix-turn-helix domain-containing protein [Paracoccaceae bacterium]
MQIGYARVSTEDQTTASQIDALTAAGCERVFEETASGAKTDRPVLAETIEYLREGDVLVAWRLDRVARSLPHLISLMDDLKQRGIGLRSLTEQIDTTTASGKLIFHIFAALSEFERDIIRQRTRAGLVAARKRGRVGGRPRVMTAEKITAAKKLLASGEPAKDVATMLSISLPTLYRWCPGSER